MFWSRKVMSFAGCAAAGSWFGTRTLARLTGRPLNSYDVTRNCHMARPARQKNSGRRGGDTSRPKVIRLKFTSTRFPASFTTPTAFSVPAGEMDTSPTTQVLARAKPKRLTTLPWFSNLPARATGAGLPHSTSHHVSHQVQDLWLCPMAEMSGRVESPVADPRPGW